MRRNLLPSALAALALLAACGDSGTEPEPTPESYNQISGSYAGFLAGNAQGIVLDATFSITLNQSAGGLSGSYGISGTLSDGVQTVDIQGTGSISGTIQRGNNPSVNLTVTPGLCPNQTAPFSGSYDTTNRRLTISGPVEMFDENCQVFVTYASTIILSN